VDCGVKGIEEMSAPGTASGREQRARRRRWERQRQKCGFAKFERAAKLAGKSACATETVGAGARREWGYIGTKTGLKQKRKG